MTNEPDVDVVDLEIGNTSHSSSEEQEAEEEEEIVTLLKLPR